MDLRFVAGFILGLCVGEALSVCWKMLTINEDDLDEEREEQEWLVKDGSEGHIDPRGIESGKLDKNQGDDGRFHSDQEGDRWEETGGSQGIPVVGGCNAH